MVYEMDIWKQGKKKKYVSLFVLTLFFMLILLPLPVGAASSVSSPTQCVAAAGDGTVKLKWKKSSAADYYKIFRREDKSAKFRAVKKIKRTSYTFHRLSCGTKYLFKIRAYKVIKGKTVSSAYSNTVSAVPVPQVGTPAGFTGKAGGKVISLNWKKVKNASGYEIYGAKNNGSFVLLKRCVKNQLQVSSQPKETWKFKVRARIKKDGRVFKGTYSKIITVKVPAARSLSTVKKLMQAAMLPVGKTMYVWGGGWNEADNGSGVEAVSMGVSPAWEKFFKKQSSSYDYNNTRYQIHNGLDCSGYVGWCIYNALNTTNGKKGYVMEASLMAAQYASRGWGTYTARGEIKNYKAGDIMSSACSDCGHVWIVVGECSDKSVVLVHSSPAGVQINGTVDRYGNQSSEAAGLAVFYMKKYFPQWYKKFPECTRGSSYLSHYAQMRWDVSGKSVLMDPEGYQNMNACQVLHDLFS